MSAEVMALLTDMLSLDRDIGNDGALNTLLDTKFTWTPDKKMIVPTASTRVAQKFPLDQVNEDIRERAVFFLRRLTLYILAMETEASVKTLIITIIDNMRTLNKIIAVVTLHEARRASSDVDAPYYLAFAASFVMRMYKMHNQGISTEIAESVADLPPLWRAMLHRTVCDQSDIAQYDIDQAEAEKRRAERNKAQQAKAAKAQAEKEAYMKKLMAQNMGPDGNVTYTDSREDATANGGNTESSE